MSDEPSTGHRRDAGREQDADNILRAENLFRSRGASGTSGSQAASGADASASGGRGPAASDDARADAPVAGVVNFSEPDDPLAQLLRTELAREAASVPVRDRFADILAATEEVHETRSPWRWVGVAAVLMLLAGVVAPFMRTHSTPQTPAANTAQQVPTTSGTSAGLQTMQRHLPVYFVNSQTNFFYQESRDLPTLDNALATAVNAVLNVAPNNPQYKSLWKGGSVLSATTRNNTTYINLSHDSYDAFTNRTDATTAAFQIFYTVNAVLSDNLSQAHVVLEDDGKTVVPVLGNTTDADFWSNPPSLGPVYIDSPESGAKVRAGNVTITGYIMTGVSTPSVTVAHADGSDSHTVASTITGRTNAQWQQWSCTVSLTKGEYQATVSAVETTNTVVFTVS